MRLVASLPSYRTLWGPVDEVGLPIRCANHVIGRHEGYLEV